MEVTSDPTKVRWLLQDLCVKLGFCEAARDPARFDEIVLLGADAFADAVLVAEGLRPELEKALRQQVSEFVAARFAHWNTEGA